MIVEVSDDFNSKDYSGYKPYTKPPKGYSWKDYVTFEDEHQMKIKSCHSCDIRKTGCLSHRTPRYYCHRRTEKQTSLMDY